jgi:diguanylate cyclase (GGDEF)-like protein
VDHLGQEPGTARPDATPEPVAIADVFARQRGGEAFAALHRAFSPRGARRLTIATLDSNAPSPVRFEYHADVCEAMPEPIDAQTLSLALGCQQTTVLPQVEPIRRAVPSGGTSQTLGRLAHALVAPLWCGGRHVGFCLAQGETAFDRETIDDLTVAATFAAQHLMLLRDDGQREIQTRSLALLLETARVLSREFDLDELFRRFHSLIGRVMDASIFFAALKIGDDEALEIQYNAEFGRSSHERMRMPMNTVSGEVLRTGRPVIIRQPEDWDRVRSVTFGDALNPASALIVPMKLADRVLGVLSVQSNRSRAYTETDCDIFVAISEQLAVAIENSKNLAASTQRAADLDLLVQVARAVSSELDLHRVFSKIHSQVKRVIDAPLFYVALGSGEGESVRLEYLVEGEKVFEPQKYSTTGTIVGMVIAGGKPIYVRNTSERDRLTNQPIGAGPTTVQSVIAVPMIVGGKVIGAISAQSYLHDAYSERNLELLGAIAEQSAVAVQNARLYEQARVLADHDPLTELLHHRGIQDRLAIELKRAQRTETRLALLMIDVDKFKIFNDTFGHPSGDRVLTTVAQALRRVARDTDIVGRYGGDEFCAILPDTDVDAAWRFAGRLVAEVSRRPFDVEDGRSIPIDLSIGVAVYPDDAERREELIRAADESLYVKKRAAVHASVDPPETTGLLLGNVDPFNGLIAAIANSGLYARAHMLQCNHLAAAFAQAAGLDETDRDTLLQAAALLDLGQLAVPRAILNKPGRLTEGEYELVKTHTELGANILRLMAGCEPVSEAVRHHHERFDGHGYPDGLAGQQIPLAARILTIIDSYVALTHDRPHRRAVSSDAAIDEIRQCAGTLYDPTIVKIFAKVVEKMKSDQANGEQPNYASKSGPKNELTTADQP